MLVNEFRASKLQMEAKMKKVLVRLKEIADKATENKVEFIHVGRNL